jgi:hypothetical protein
MKNREGYRVCSCCKKEQELISTNFCSDKNRKSGFSYRCKKCDAIKKDNRKERYKKLSEEQKEVYKSKNRKYTSEGLGRATSLICAYRKVDKKKGQVCNLDREFMMTQIFNKSCIYCKSIQNIGCDRIDNTIGHIKTNVVPCCRICNTTRMNNFSHEEMFLLGEVIQKINKNKK